MKKTILITALLLANYFVKSQTFHFDEIKITSEILTEPETSNVEMTMNIDLEKQTVVLISQEGTLSFKITKYLDEYKNKFIILTEDEGGMMVELTMYQNYFDWYDLSTKSSIKNKIHRKFRIKK